MATPGTTPKRRRTLLVPPTRQACSACRAHKRRCDERRPCRRCVQAHQACVDGAADAAVLATTSAARPTRDSGGADSGADDALQIPAPRRPVGDGVPAAGDGGADALDVLQCLHQLHADVTEHLRLLQHTMAAAPRPSETTVFADHIRLIQRYLDYHAERVARSLAPRAGAPGPGQPAPLLAPLLAGTDAEQAVAVWDTSGPNRLALCNRAFLQLLRHDDPDAADISGISITDIVPARVAHYVETLFGMLSSGRFRTAESKCVFLCADRTEVCAHISITACHERQLIVTVFIPVDACDNSISIDGIELPPTQTVPPQQCGTHGCCGAADDLAPFNL